MWTKPRPGDERAAVLLNREGADGAERVVYNSWQASRLNIAAVYASSRSVLLTAGAAIVIPRSDCSATEGKRGRRAWFG